RLTVLTSMAIGLASCQARPKGDTTSKEVPSAKLSPKEEFEGKFKEIQIDMSEQQVDQILAGYPCFIDKLTALEMKLFGPPDGPYKRSPIFRKTYNEKPDAIERDYYIDVLLDQDYMVVDKDLGEYIK